MKCACGCGESLETRPKQLLRSGTRYRRGHYQNTPEHKAKLAATWARKVGETTRVRMARLLSEEPDLSTRDLIERLGVSETRVLQLRRSIRLTAP